MKECVITGRGIISTYGAGVEILWNNILNQKNNFKDFHFKDDKKVIGRVDDTNLHLTLKDEEKRKLDRLSLFTIECAKLALSDAKLDLASYAKERIGVIFTTYHGGIMINYKELCNLLFKSPSYVSAFWFPATTFNFPSGAIARYFKLNNSVNTCIVGSPAVWYGCYMLQQGLLDIVILISADEFFDGICYFFCQNNLARSVNNDFALESGVIYAEAWAALVIETKENAIKRNAKIYAEIEKIFEFTVPSIKTNYQRFYTDFSQVNDEIVDAITKKINSAKICLWLGTANGVSDSFFNEIAFIKKVIRKNVNTKVFYTNIKEYVGETFSSSPLINLIIGTEIFEKAVIFGLGKVNKQYKEDTENTNLFLVEENINVSLNTIISSTFLPNGVGGFYVIKKQ